MEKLLQKHKKEFEYKFSEKRITVKLNKEVLQKHDKNREDEDERRRQKLISALDNNTHASQESFTFLEEEDKEETLKICEDMLDILYHARKAGFENDIFSRLRSYLITK